MNTYANAQLGLSNGMVETQRSRLGDDQCTNEPGRQQPFFSQATNTILIGGEAASAAIASLKSLMGRLGIGLVYGTIDCGSEDPKAAGAMEDMDRKLAGLVDLCRELRGLAETIDARL